MKQSRTHDRVDSQCASSRHDEAYELMATIPIITTHREIGIHDQQSAARVEVVKVAIDYVASLANILELAAFAADTMQPPESRLFAAGKVLPEYELGRRRTEESTSGRSGSRRCLCGGLKRWRLVRPGKRRLPA